MNQPFLEHSYYPQEALQGIIQTVMLEPLLPTELKSVQTHLLLCRGLLIIASTHLPTDQIWKRFFKLVTFKAGFTGGQDTELRSPPQLTFFF